MIGAGALRREQQENQIDRLAVEPEDRLVARNVENDWNEKLAAVEQLEQEQVTLPMWAASRGARKSGNAF